MALPLNALELTIRIQLANDNEEMAVVCGFVRDDPPWTDANIASTASALRALIRNLMTTDYIMPGWRARVGQDGAPLLFEGVFTSANWAGLVAPPSTPQNCAFLVKKVTGSGGRRNRGRMFVPGVAEADVGGTGVVTASRLTSFATAVTNFFSTDLPGTVDMAILHDSEPLTPTKVTNLILDGRIATQRRRLRR